MNVIHTYCDIKSFTFESVKEINNYYFMSITDRAKHTANLIKPFIKAVDKDIFYTYNNQSKMWQVSHLNDFTNFCFDFYNETSKNFKLILKETKKTDEEISEDTI